MNEGKPAAPKPIIEVSLISKTYTHKDKITHALRDVSLFVAKQDIYGIIGLSGAGKSTLIRCLAGLITPSTGKILFNGSDIRELKGANLRAFRQKIGMIFQHFNLLSSRTVAGNVTYPLEIAGVSKAEQEKRVDELLRLVGLTSKKDVYPASLSGGEKQRVGIARALANHPEVLFCDEATSALDPRTTQEILDLLKTINKNLGVTVVLITHDMEVIKRACNKVAVIEAGRIVEEGPVSEVFAEPQHPTTKQFIQGSSHEIPEEFYKTTSPNRVLLRLRFKGSAANDPLISQIVKKFHVDANILLGWIDRLQTTTVGTLVIELIGPAEGISGALNYLAENTVHHEVLQQHEP
ncbi:methionine ABC transporter ATP-binding protein [Estrella lausannensis]|uniref:Cell division ATP-binding protein FtsE n=1 Tax=Estrella lausannensis TaxID=483423 RepID=A0A0H5E7L6_9BACT|nr:ATP-binding cassette domain-containing protein [Estrella lausannensis]CRX39320.1 Methionine import ATP-binding protein MetN [Estrella lausannensis]